jgi:hypothetical protein
MSHTGGLSTFCRLHAAIILSLPFMPAPSRKFSTRPVKISCAGRPFATEM